MTHSNGSSSSRLTSRSRVAGEVSPLRSSRRVTTTVIRIRKGKKATWAQYTLFYTGPLMSAQIPVSHAVSVAS